MSTPLPDVSEQGPGGTRGGQLAAELRAVTSAPKAGGGSAPVYAQFEIPFPADQRGREEFSGTVYERFVVVSNRSTQMCAFHRRPPNPARSVSGVLCWKQLVRLTGFFGRNASTSGRKFRAVAPTVHRCIVPNCGDSGRSTLWDRGTYGGRDHWTRWQPRKGSPYPARWSWWGPFPT